MVLFCVIGFSQTSIKNSSLSSGGNASSNGNNSILYSIGELAIKEQTVSSYHLSEGFINPTINQTLGINTYTTLNGIKMYPNPTKGMVNISFENLSTYDIHIFDMLGNKIKHFNVNSIAKTLDISSLNNAVYLLIITDKKNKKTVSYKLIKN